MSASTETQSTNALRSRFAGARLLEESNRARIYERTADTARPPLREHAEEMPTVSTGSMVAMILGTLLLAMLAVWAIAQADGFALFSAGGLERHFCRYLTC